MHHLMQLLVRHVRAFASAVSINSLPAQAIVQQFRAAGALTPSTAQPFRAHSTIEEFEFRRLLRAQVIREATVGRYYLDRRALNQAMAWRDE